MPTPQTEQIKVLIADRIYSISINNNEEEIVRKAEELIKQKLLEMRGSFGANDRQDALAMTLLSMYVELLCKNKQEQEIQLKINELDLILTNFL